MAKSDTVAGEGNKDWFFSSVLIFYLSYLKYIGNWFIYIYICIYLFIYLKYIGNWC